VHVPTLAAAEAIHPAEDLSSHLVQWHALRDREMVGAMGADNRVVLIQMSADPDGDGLLTRCEMHLTGNHTGTDVERQAGLNIRWQLFLEIDGRHRLLEVADGEHLFVHPNQVGT
jgi:hypothetical protein